MDQIYYLFSKYYHNLLLTNINSNSSDNTSELLIKKYIHTFRVINNIKEICLREDIDKIISKQAEIAALFHDIGRFAQAIEFGHFRDNLSFDHAEKSADIFLEFKNILLQHLTETELFTIEQSIRYHNKLNLPSDLSKEIKIVCNILRDADKINILSINLKSDFIAFDGKDKKIDVINPVCLRDFYNHQVIKNTDIKSHLDNNIKLLSWIYDFNYKTSLNMYIEEGFIDIITDTSNMTDLDIVKTISSVKKYALSYIKNK